LETVLTASYNVTKTNNTKQSPGHTSGEWRNSGAFAVIKADGSVVTWGANGYGGNSSAVTTQLNGTIDVTQIYSGGYAFAALRSDGSVVTWGGGDGIYGGTKFGGNSSAVASQLNGTIDVTQISSTFNAFAALRSDGSVITWGGSDGYTYNSGGDSSAVASQLNGTIDVTQISSTYDAFAALRSDGSVVTWGVSAYGGNSSVVASQLNGAIDVTQIYSTESAFAALRSDGSVVTWGANGYLGIKFGGDSSAVATQLNGTIDVTQISSTFTGFAALRSDGSVVRQLAINTPHQFFRISFGHPVFYGYDFHQHR
jgi:alpha-tubulin suppressor-like RCC1 family protein